MKCRKIRRDRYLEPEVTLSDQSLSDVLHQVEHLSNDIDIGISIYYRCSVPAVVEEIENVALMARDGKDRARNIRMIEGIDLTPQSRLPRWRSAVYLYCFRQEIHKTNAVLWVVLDVRHVVCTRADDRSYNISEGLPQS